ncbi:hypothetical protein ACF0H5_004546 [Mactra antiquata]
MSNGWCPEHMGQKKRKHEELSDSEQKEDTVEDNEAYVLLWKRARKSNDQKFEKIYNTFIDNGEESDNAQEQRIQPYNEKDFIGKYQTLIENYILPLRNNRLHIKIMAQIDKMISKGHSSTSAATKVTRNISTRFKINLIWNLLMMKVVKKRKKKMTPNMYKLKQFD